MRAAESAAMTKGSSALSERSWLGWSLFAAFAAVLLIVVVSAWRRAHNDPNRGPANEAAPDAQPSRDIDRSRRR